MRGKSILALAVALAMIFSVIPAFGLTASAADGSEVIAAYNPDTLIAHAKETAEEGDGYSFIGQTDPVGNSAQTLAWDSDALKGTNWEGWSGVGGMYWASGEWIDVKNSMFIDIGDVDGEINASQAVKDGTAGKDYIVITWKGYGDQWCDYGIVDNDGQMVDTFRFTSKSDTGISYHWAHDGWGAQFPDNCTDYVYTDNEAAGDGVAEVGAQYYVVLANNQNGGYSVFYFYKNGDAPVWIGKKVYAEGSVNGFAGFSVGPYAGAKRIANFEVHAGSYPEAAPIQVKVTYNDTEASEVQVLDLTIDTTKGETEIHRAAQYIYHEGKVYFIPELTTVKDETIEVETHLYKSHEDEEYFYVESADAMYKYAGDNVIVNGDFATGTTDGWTNYSGGELSGGNKQILTDESLGSYLSIQSYNQAASQTIVTEWDVEPGTTYYLSFWVGGKKPDAGDNQEKYNRVVQSDEGRAFDVSSGSENDLVVFGKDMVDGQWTHFEKVFEATASKVVFNSRWAAGAMTFAAFELVPVEKNEEATKVPTTVTINDSEGVQLGTYDAGDAYVGQSVTVPSGAYNGTDGHWYLDAPVQSTLVEGEDAGTATAVAAPLTAFTWETSSNAVMNNNVAMESGNTYNAGRIVYWGSSSQNRTGYVLSEIPEYDSATQNLEMTLSVHFNNHNDTDYPVGVFSFVDPEEIKGVDINGADTTTAALAELEATEFTRIAFADHKKDATLNNYRGTVSVVLPGESVDKTGEVAIKMHDDGNVNGIVMVYGITFTPVTKAVTVTYQTPEGGTIGTEEIMPVDGKLDIKAREVVFEGKFYTIAETQLDAEGATATVQAEAVEGKNAATKMENSVGGNLNMNGYNVGVAGTNNAEIAEKDADGTPLYNGAVHVMGTERRTAITFVKPEATETQLIKLYLPVGTAKQNSTNYGDGEFRLVAKTDDGETYSVNALTDTEANNGAKPYDEPVVLVFDVTKLLASVEAGQDAVVTLATRMGGAGFVDLDMAKFGGAKEGIAPYLAVEDGVKVTVTASDGALITRNGAAEEATEFYASEGDTVRVYQGEDVASKLANVIVNGDTANASAVAEVLAEETTITLLSDAGLELGVELANGAQVRIDKSYAGNIAEGSGLRFIGIRTKDGSALSDIDGAQIGVKISPKDDPTQSLIIPIDSYQNGDEETGTIFTAVLTNLKPTNYNRVFTATPVVTLNGEVFEGEESVERSIFEVAAGILVNGNADTTAGLGEYKMDDVVKAVLNTYVNAVGVRFEITKETGVVTNANDYNFGKQPITVFDVDVTGENGVYTYTVTPQGDVKVDIDAFKDAVRINNNNKAVQNGITNVEAVGNGVKFTFTVANAVATSAD